jgi:mannose-6-phosphate isomerase-like protein (cupin superfamily)
MMRERRELHVQVRRIVTGHDDQGRAVVKIDEVIEGAPRRPNTTAIVLWTTTGFPVDNTDDQDQRQGAMGTTLPNGSVFRVVEFGPGNAGRVHRTDSVDYGVVLSGEIDMELEEGESVHLYAGDMLVQRGTIHNWINRGTEPCTIAFILIDARPVIVDGRVLEARG